MALKQPFLRILVAATCLASNQATAATPRPASDESQISLENFESSVEIEGIGQLPITTLHQQHYVPTQAEIDQSLRNLELSGDPSKARSAAEVKSSMSQRQKVAWESADPNGNHASYVAYPVGQALTASTTYRAVHALTTAGKSEGPCIASAYTKLKKLIASDPKLRFVMKMHGIVKFEFLLKSFPDEAKIGEKYLEEKIQTPSKPNVIEQYTAQIPIFSADSGKNCNVRSIDSLVTALTGKGTRWSNHPEWETLWNAAQARGEAQDQPEAPAGR